MSSSRRRRRLLASRCRVIRLRLYPHSLYPHRLYPHRYPHPCPHPRTPDHSAGRRAVVSPCPPLSSPLSSPPGAHHSSSRRRRVYRYPHPSLGESMRRCNDCEGLGGCSEARVVVASSSPRFAGARTSTQVGEDCWSWGDTRALAPRRSGRVSPVPQSAATTRACRSACVFVVVAGSHLAFCTRVRRSKRPGKTHRDKYHESLRDVGGLYLAGSGQRQQRLEQLQDSRLLPRRAEIRACLLFAQAIAVLSKWSLRLQKRPHLDYM